MFNHNQENEAITVEKVDNGFIVIMEIPPNYNPAMKAFEHVATTMAKAQEKVIDSWKPGDDLEVPADKFKYTFVCKTESEVMDLLKQFFERCKK